MKAFFLLILSVIGLHSMAASIDDPSARKLAPSDGNPGSNGKG